MRLLDHRFQGVVRGVGARRLLGKIHQFDMIIQGDKIPQSFSVLEDPPAGNPR